MFVSATEVQNNFGKYLKLCKVENIIITRNGKKRAVLLSYPRDSEGYELGEPIPEYGTNPKKRENYVTYQKFLELTENSENRYELIDGEVFLLASPRFTHQRILGELHIAFWGYFKDKDGCDPFLAPFDVNLIRQPIKLRREINEDDINVVQPDVLVICDYENEIDEKDRYQGTPTLVVEILSPSTRSKDCIKKLSLYMESGIDEYWVIDPKGKTVTIHSFKEHDIEGSTYFPKGHTAGSICFPGLSVDVDALF